MRAEPIPFRPPLTGVRLDLTVREAQILTALVGGIVNNYSGRANETTDCMEDLYWNLQDIVGDTRPVGEVFTTLFHVTPQGDVECRQ